MGLRTTIIWIGVSALVAGGGVAARADEPTSPGPAPVESLGFPRTALQPGFEPPPILPPRPDGPGREPPLSPFLDPTPAAPRVDLPDGAVIPLPASTRQLIRFSPRYGKPFNTQSTGVEAETNTRRVLLTGGVIVSVTFLGAAPGAQQEIEFAADTVVAWIKGAGGRNVLGGLDTSADGSGKMAIELYLAGDVVIRTVNAGGARGAVEQVFRADEIYYDVPNSRAVAVCADLELRGAGFTDPLHVRSQEIWRLGKNEWRAFDALTSASKRPSDPNLTAGATETRLIQRQGYRTNVFGIPYRNTRTGEKVYANERTLTNYNSTVRILGVPVFYWPKTVSDLSEPFGPFQGIGFGNDNVFGTQIFTTWDIYKLLALKPPPRHTWRLDLDYLSDRGPAGGTVYNYVRATASSGTAGRPSGMFKAYGIQDRALFDQLGGSRGDQPPKPDFRGRLLARHNQDLYEEGTTYLRTMGQVSYLTDKNFLEQYYKQEFDLGPNQETFNYTYGATGNLYGASWLEARIHRPWITETEWLPRFDGAAIGKTFLDDRLVYSARGSAGYANFRPAEQTPLPILPTDQATVGLGRFDINQRVSAPFDLGFLRINPYGVMDLAYYSQTLDQTQASSGQQTGFGQVYGGTPGFDYTTKVGDGRGRFYGGGGVEASSTASRLYPDARSELFNVNGLNHKVTVSGNYFAAYSDSPYTMFPQLDRMFDDSLDQGYRNTRPMQQYLYTIPDGLNADGTQRYARSPAGIALSSSPLFDPQQYAIRRLVENKPDTLATLQEVQLALRQRLQTKRGFPGSEHTIDWMTLDLSASAFPDPQRDNYGQTWSFLEYNYLWHVGDRFSLTSAGWYDPFEFGARYYNVGMNFNRPDGTNFYVSYRHTDPINSRAVTAATSYRLSYKYAMNLSTTYDFGTNEALTNTLSLARTGPDMTMIVGFTYNALINNFGFQFTLLPNVASLAPGQRAYSSGLSGR